MRFELVTPEKLFASRDNVAHVMAPGEEGYFGVLPGHMPLISTLQGEGDVTVEDASGNSQTFKVREGFVEVTPESVTVLAKSAEEVVSER